MLPAPEPLLIKICGLSTAPTLDAALDAGADMVGFVFFPRSPRHLSYERARDLGARVEGRSLKVALNVDADDATLDAIVAAVAPDALQLHGAESVARMRELKGRYGLPLIKAIHVSGREDLAGVATYEGVADRLIFDARPPKGAALPGGNGAAFDWTILAGVETPLPWMLSGGLGPDNVGEALRVTGARGLDVSSGVERAPGEKDPALIRLFIERARGFARESLGSRAPSA